MEEEEEGWWKEEEGWLEEEEGWREEEGWWEEELCTSSFTIVNKELVTLVRSSIRWDIEKSVAWLLTDLAGDSVNANGVCGLK